MARYSAASPKRSHRVLPRWLKIATLALLVAANLAALGVWWTIRSAEDAFRDNARRDEEVVAELDVRPTVSSQPLYFLVIGSDSREGVDTDLFGDFGGARSDVVMVARIDRAEGRVLLLSIPRDTLVTVPGHGEDKINAAYAFGGASLMVRTVREAFDLPIHHYVEVDFAGFQSLVDELGGVEMTFPHPARDPKSRLDVPAGTVTLDGFQALAYARSRTYQELRDGTWTSVDAGDIGRTRRQQALVMGILSRLKRPSTLAETGPVVASIARHMTVDAALADSSLAELAFSMRDVGGSDIEAVTLPTRGSTRNGASVQLLEQPAADEMLEGFRNGRLIDDQQVEAILSVDVLNGNGIAGAAAEWASHLDGAGYTVNRVDNATEELESTLVMVDAAHRSAASQLVDDLGFGQVEVGSVPAGVDAVVILGADAGEPVS
ncbi:MAG: LCP family protein [Actinomycetota bacterium]